MSLDECDWSKAVVVDWTQTMSERSQVGVAGPRWLISGRIATDVRSTSVNAMVRGKEGCNPA